MKKNEYLSLITKPSPVLKNGLLAALSGGTLSALAEGLSLLLEGPLAFAEEEAAKAVTLFFVGAASLLTALGLFSRLGALFGAGLFLPVTGFSNAITSAALDAKAEGFLLGEGSKIFSVAGPVLLYAAFFGTLYGLLYYATGVLL